MVPEDPTQSPESPRSRPGRRRSAPAPTARTRSEELLDACTRVAVSGGSLAEIGEGILSTLVAASGADSGLLLLREPGGGGSVIAVREAMPASAAHGLARGVEQAGHPLLVADLRTDRRVAGPGADDLLGHGFRSYLCQPLLAAGGALGTLHLASRPSESFDTVALDAAARAARVLALAVRAHRSRVESERLAEDRAREVSLLLEMSRGLGHVRGRAEIPDLLLEKLARIADADLGAVVLVEGDRASVTVQEELPLPAALRRRAGDRALEALEEHGGGRPATVDRQELRSGSGLLAGPVAPAWRSELAAPLRSRGRVAGMVLLVAHRRSAFSEVDRRLLTTVSGLVSLTLERLDRALEDERSRIESVVDAMGEGLLWVDAAGRLELANPAGRRSLLDLLGEPQPAELHRLGDVDLDGLREEFAGGRRTRYQAEVGSGAGARAYTLTASPVRGRAGEPQGMVLVLSDVTEQRGLQAKLMQTEKLSSLGEMISGVAHELNNPLTAVMGYAQLLEGAGDLGAEIVRKIRGISEQAARCQRVVQNLLSFARNHEPEQGPVDINGMIRSVIHLMGPPLRVDGIELRQELSGDLPAVRGDVHQLQQVLLNLVTNAHQAIRSAAAEGGAAGHISIRTAPVDGRVRIVVEDDGPGILPGHLNRVFDPFFTTKEVGVGTGLGLSLAYGCITEHGGEIRVESRPGAGARFLIDLPGAAVRERPEAPLAVPARPTGGGLSSRDVLVVDDEPAIAELIAEALRAAGHHVDIVHDGRVARERLREQRYDLVLTDLKMPHMSGVDLYEDLERTDPEMAGRMIFSTGDTVSRETAAFLRRFEDRCLTKPFRLHDLHAVVERVLEAGEGRAADAG
ncbi:MAG: ATP-binding protein [Acidobacteriota bacterium]